MPTVGRIDGLRIVIYFNDHRPAHVHAIGDGCSAIFQLGCPDGPVILRENYGFAGSTMGKINEALTLRLRVFCAEWTRIHGAT